MNKKGIFSFVLILAFLSAFIVFQNKTSESTLSFNETLNTAIEAEQNNKIRAILEENTDKIIQETLKEEILKENINPETIKREVSKKLFDYFKKTEEQSTEFRKIKFFSGTFSQKQYNEIVFSKNLTELKESDLIENSKAIIVAIPIEQIGLRGFLAEYSFTGGLMKNKIIVGKISSKNNEQIFLIPINYSIKTMGAVPI